ncbi:MAG TPA: HU family DNA-binding protein [bacterium]|nr:MAG: DNA-binding protein HRm [Parcubacteria group bacterium ADurb.Bin115]HNU81400.1 HU family DNA-binding protein [bacterium]HOD87316.1 HU family DNA-binding protein [bacterium]HPW05953.1 HU family DNA-binding protein [bacterium]HPY99736.1 HU family DNA-binding protein [bacterium]
MSKMTKAQIVAAMSQATGLSKKDVNGFFETLSEMTYKEVKKNGECLVPGFGKLVKAKRKAREGRNPATGETINIPAKTVVKFRLAKAVKDAVL